MKSGKKAAPAQLGKAQVQVSVNFGNSSSQPWCNGSSASSLHGSTASPLDMAGTSADLSISSNYPGFGPNCMKNKSSSAPINFGNDLILESFLPSLPPETCFSKSSKNKSCSVHGRSRCNPKHHRKCQDVLFNYKEDSTVSSWSSCNSRISNNWNHRLQNPPPSKSTVSSWSSCNSRISNNWNHVVQNPPPSKLQLTDVSKLPRDFSSIYAIVLSYYKSQFKKSRIPKSAESLSSEANFSDWRHYLCASTLAMVPYDFGKLLFLLFTFSLPQCILASKDQLLQSNIVPAMSPSLYNHLNTGILSQNPFWISLTILLSNRPRTNLLVSKIFSWCVCVKTT